LGPIKGPFFDFMPCLYIDCFSGISGDMMVAGLLDLGLDLETLKGFLSQIPVEGYRICSKRVKRGGIRASLFQVEVSQPQPIRKAEEIISIIQKSKLKASVKEKACGIFKVLAEAEGRVHGVPAEEVHFHEVGAVDSIVDVLSIAVGLEELQIDDIYCSPIPLGRGVVNTMHGPLPLPAPATMLLLEGCPVYGVSLEEELVTPTGAAVVKALSKDFGKIPPIMLERIGMGAGHRDIAGWPNVLRLFVGERLSNQPGDVVIELTANVDDRAPYEMGFLMDLLMEAGALDVCFLPCYMKKNRPAFQLQVLLSPTHLERITSLLFQHGITLGVRYAVLPRIVLERWEEKISSPWGDIRVKFSKDPNGKVMPRPEYEDLRLISQRFGLPLWKIREWVIGKLLDY